MNNQEFLSESLEYVKSTYETFQNYQQIVNDIFDRFHKVCIENGITYYYSYGSLLGLIRDHGNIPWDYDIDVIVPIDQRENLISVLDKKLGDDYYYVYKNNTRHYPTSCLRVCKKGYTYTALHVDVFFLMGCPEDRKEREKFQKKVSWAYKARRKHNARFHFEDMYNSRIRRMLSIIYGYIKYPVSEQRLSEYEDSLYTKYPLNISNNCMIFYPMNKAYSTNDFGQNRIVSINGRQFSIPECPEKILSEQYGNYKAYLPIQSRFDEFYKMCLIVDSRQKNYEKKLNHFKR